MDAFKKKGGDSHSALRLALFSSMAAATLVVGLVFVQSGGAPGFTSFLARAGIAPSSQTGGIFCGTGGSCGSGDPQISITADATTLTLGQSTTLHATSIYYDYTKVFNATAGESYNNGGAYINTVNDVYNWTSTVTPTQSTTYGVEGIYPDNGIHGGTGVTIVVVCPSGQTGTPPSCSGVPPSNDITVACGGNNELGCPGGTFNNVGQITKPSSGSKTLSVQMASAPHQAGDAIAATAIVMLLNDGSEAHIYSPDTNYPSNEVARSGAVSNQYTFTVTPSTPAGTYYFYPVTATTYFAWDDYPASPGGWHNIASISVFEAASTVSISASGSPGEPSTTGTYTVSRTGSTASQIAVNFSMSGTATRCTTSSCATTTDYKLVPNGGTGGGCVVLTEAVGNASIPSGSASCTVTLQPVDNATVESTETAIMTAVAGSGYTVGSPSAATLNITDNDSAAPSCTVTPASTSYTSPASATINYTTTGSPTSISIYDGGVLIQTVSSPASSGSVTDSSPAVGSHTVSGIAQPGSVSCGAGSNGTTFTEASGGGGNSVSVSASGSPAEPSSTGTFTILRSGSTASSVTVTFSMSGSAAVRCTTSTTPSSCAGYHSTTASKDYVLTGGGISGASGTTVTLGSGVSSVNVTVTPVDDYQAESAENIIMSLTAPSGYTLGTGSTALSLSDNDSASFAQPTATIVSKLSGSQTTDFTVGDTAAITATFTKDSADTWSRTGIADDSHSYLTSSGTTNPRTYNFPVTEPGSYIFYAQAQTSAYPSATAYKSVTINASCPEGTDWDGDSCVEQEESGSCALTAPASVSEGDSPTLEWTVPNDTVNLIIRDDTGDYEYSPKLLPPYSDEAQGPEMSSSDTFYLTYWERGQEEGSNCDQVAFVNIGGDEGRSGLGKGLMADPTRVRKGQQTTLTWNTTDDSCTVTDQTGHVYSTQTSSPEGGVAVTINNATTFTLSCTGYLNGENADPTTESSSRSVTILPAFQEI